MTDPKEPTLTCSEVVERLAKEAATEIMKKRHNLGYGFITTVAEDTEIIKRVFIEWRERRVQELEEALRITSASIAKEMNRFDYEELDGSGAVITAEEVYKQSLEKAREQIRKGQK